MTSKHWALVGGAVACLASFASAAAPWMGPGDSRARFAVQKLADRGHMDRTLSTWPLMWGTVHSGLQPDITPDQFSVSSAAAYLRFEKGQQAEQGFRGEYSLFGSSEIRAVRGFDQNIPFFIGFQGMMDETKVYDIALSPRQVLKQFNTLCRLPQSSRLLSGE